MKLRKALTDLLSKEWIKSDAFLKGLACLNIALAIIQLTVVAVLAWNARR